MTRLVIEVLKVLEVPSVVQMLETAKTNDSLLHSFSGSNFLHFAIFLFVLCSAVLVTVSLLTKPQPAEKISHLTFSNRAKTDSTPLLQNKLFWLSALLLACIGVLWVVFS